MNFKHGCASSVDVCRHSERSLSVSAELDRALWACGAHTQAEALTALWALSTYGILPMSTLSDCASVSDPFDTCFLVKISASIPLRQSPATVLGSSSSYYWSLVNAAHTMCIAPNFPLHNLHWSATRLDPRVTSLDLVDNPSLYFLLA